MQGAENIVERDLTPEKIFLREKMMVQILIQDRKTPFMPRRRGGPS